MLMCDHTYCYTPAVRRIRELIRGGEIGEVQFVDSVRINLGLVQPDVDVLWDLAPHDLSILDFVLPEDVSLSRWPRTPATRSAPGGPASPTCRSGCPTGALAHVHVNWLSPTKIRTTVFGGSRRTIVWDDMNPSARLMLHDRGVDRVPGDALAPDERRQALISYRIGDMHAPGAAGTRGAPQRHGRVRRLRSRSAGRRSPTLARAAGPRASRGRIAER